MQERVVREFLHTIDDRTKLQERPDLASPGKSVLALLQPVNPPPALLRCPTYCNRKNVDRPEGGFQAAPRSGKKTKVQRQNDQIAGVERTELVKIVGPPFALVRTSRSVRKKRMPRTVLSRRIASLSASAASPLFAVMYKPSIALRPTTAVQGDESGRAAASYHAWLVHSIGKGFRHFLLDQTRDKIEHLI